MKAIWDYIHGYSRLEAPELITFYDHHDAALYRDVSIQTIGKHGWELVSVFQSLNRESGESRYEYFFKRNREEGYPAGLSGTGAHN